MNKISSRIVIIVGLVSLPLAVSPRLGQSIPAADYRNDPRFERLQAFFAKLDCPAWEYAATFLEAADDYALDWRLLPSLSYVESTGGKAARHNNLFGWNSGRAVRIPSSQIRGADDMISCSSSSVEGSAQ